MRPQIVLFGDSITQQSFRSGGWGAALADIYSRKVDVVLRGYSGYNTRWALFMLNQIFPLLIGSENHSKFQEPELIFQFCSCQHQTGSAKPLAAVTIFFGANDAARLEGTGKRQHVPVEEYKDNLRKMVQHIKSGSPNALVVLITPPPIDVEGRREYARSLYGDKASETPDRTNEATGVYAKQCVTLANELGLPSVDLWSKMQQNDGWQKKFLSDGLHLTPEGNAVVFSEVVKIFDKAGFSDLPYDFPSHSDIDAEHPEKAFSQHCPAV